MIIAFTGKTLVKLEPSYIAAENEEWAAALERVII
jgi:hypothetical protein